MCTRKVEEVLPVVSGLASRIAIVSGKRTSLLKSRILPPIFSSHRPFAALAMLAFCITPEIHAQAANDSGPSLAETMNFINEKLQQRGAFSLHNSTISFEGFSGNGCEQTYRMVTERQPPPGDGEISTTLSLLRLEQGDPASVSILQPSGNDSPFQVAINKLAFNTQSTFHLQQARTFNLTARDLVFGAVKGRVLSIDGSSMVFLPEKSGIPYQMSYDRSVEFYSGPWLTAKHEGPKNIKTWNFDRPKAHWSDVGVGDDVDIRSLLEVGSSRNRIFFQKHPDTTAPGLPDPEIISPNTRQIGPERKQFIFGYSKDRDDAERMAKAIIHAIVLCQKDQKPSLF